jgi:Sec1 family
LITTFDISVAAAALTRTAHAQLVSDHLQGGGGGVFGGWGLASTAAQRPLLVILDRTADLVTPLRHTSTYQALLDDVLEHRVNRVTVEIEGKVSFLQTSSFSHGYYSLHLLITV